MIEELTGALQQRYDWLGQQHVTAAGPIIAVSLSIAALMLFQRLSRGDKSPATHAKACARARAARDTKQHECLRLHGTEPQPGDAAIVCRGAADLCRAMRAGELRCEAVMLAFIRRAHAIGRGTLNSVTEELYDEAWAVAKSLDASGALTGSDMSSSGEG